MDIDPRATGTVKRNLQWDGKRDTVMMMAETLEGIQEIPLTVVVEKMASMAP